MSKPLTIKLPLDSKLKVELSEEARRSLMNQQGGILLQRFTSPIDFGDFVEFCIQYVEKEAFLDFASQITLILPETAVVEELQPKITIPMLRDFLSKK